MFNTKRGKSNTGQKIQWIDPVSEPLKRKTPVRACRVVLPETATYVNPFWKAGHPALPKTIAQPLELPAYTDKATPESIDFGEPEPLITEPTEAFENSMLIRVNEVQLYDFPAYLHRPIYYAYARKRIAKFFDNAQRLTRHIRNPSLDGQKVWKKVGGFWVTVTRISETLTKYHPKDEYVYLGNYTKSE